MLMMPGDRVCILRDVLASRVGTNEEQWLKAPMGGMVICTTVPARELYNYETDETLDMCVVLFDGRGMYLVVRSQLSWIDCT